MKFGLNCIIWDIYTPSGIVFHIGIRSYPSPQGLEILIYLICTNITAKINHFFYIFHQNLNVFLLKKIFQFLPEFYFA